MCFLRGQGVDRKTLRFRLAATVFSVAVVLSVAAAPCRPVARQPAPARASHRSQARPIAVPPAKAQPAEQKCPDHAVKTWAASYRGRTFRVTRLPRCQHIESLIAYNAAGETKEQAQRRLQGIAVCSGSFHHPRTMAIADFLQNKGEVITDPTTHRWFLAVLDDSQLKISGNYDLLKGRHGVSALALGQRLVPLHQDGFSRAFYARGNPAHGPGAVGGFDLHRAGEIRYSAAGRLHEEQAARPERHQRRRRPRRLRPGPGAHRLSLATGPAAGSRSGGLAPWRQGRHLVEARFHSLLRVSDHDIGCRRVLYSGVWMSCDPSV